MSPVTYPCPMFHRLLPIFLLLVLSGCSRESISGADQPGLPPLPPADLLIQEAHDGYAVLDWLKNDEPTIAYYVLYRSADSSNPRFLPIDSTLSTIYVDQNLDYDSLYSWFVVAVDRWGQRSEASNIVRSRSPNEQDPPEPSDLFVHAIDEGSPNFLLSWTPPAIADLGQYRIWRSESSDPLNDPSASRFETTSSSWRDTSPGLLPNVRYYYAIKTEDRGGRLSAGISVDADVLTERPALSAPAEAAFVPSWPTLSWRRVPSAVAYRVAVMDLPSGGERWSTEISHDGSTEYQASYAGPALQLGRVYYWRVATVTKSDGAPNAFSEIRSFQVVE